MKDWIGWLALFILSIVLIITGFTGSVGRLLACILVPSQVVENS